MITEWWLEQNLEFGGFDNGREWLVGFHSHLREDELHQVDWEHIKELTTWHKEQEQETEREKQKQRERESQNMGAAEMQPLLGPLSLAL
jgi:hypothetical protein